MKTSKSRSKPVITSGHFEKYGHAADFFRVEFVTDDGVIVLDTFSGNGEVLTGDKSGQRITTRDTTVKYELPEGLGEGQLRFVSDISARNERIKIDDVKITGDQPVTPPRVDILCELFDDRHPDTVAVNHFEINNGQLITDGDDDGRFEFKPVDLSGFENVEVSFEACITSGHFEKYGHAADFFRVEFVTDDGVIVLDTFSGNGEVLTGDKSGQRITTRDTTLKYELPEGLGEGQLRFVSDISARNERIKIDDVKITGDQPAFELVKDQLVINEDDASSTINLFENDVVSAGATLSVVTVNVGTGPNVGEIVFDFRDGAASLTETITSRGGREANVTLTKDGDLTIETIGNFGDLASGEQDLVSFDVTATDAAGNTGNATAAINVVGDDDFTLTFDRNDIDEADTPFSFNLFDNDTADNGKSVGDQLVVLEGQNGTLFDFRGGSDRDSATFTLDGRSTLDNTGTFTVFENGDVIFDVNDDFAVTPGANDRFGFNYAVALDGSDEILDRANVAVFVTDIDMA